MMVKRVADGAADSVVVIVVVGGIIGRKVVAVVAGRGRVGRPWGSVLPMVVVEIFVERTTSSVHEKVGDCRRFEAQLFRNGVLHVLIGSLRLPEDGHQCPSLDVREDQPRFLGISNGARLACHRAGVMSTMEMVMVMMMVMVVSLYVFLLTHC